MAFDQGTLSVDQEIGNKGLGTIVAILCGIGICLPSYFTISQMLEGTATGNPVGALIFLLLALGAPLYWGVKQFYLRRKLSLHGDGIKFSFVTPFSTKDEIVPFCDFYQLSIGKTQSRSTADHDNAIGYTGVYYVRLRSQNKKYSFDLYNAVQNQMAQDRIEKYSRMLSLPVENHLN